MGVSLARYTILAAALLGGCSTLPHAQPSAISLPELPPDVGNGAGSQLGNYGGTFAGDAKGPTGQHCVVFNWDRPLTKDFAIRYSSLSCDQVDKEWKTTTSYTRTVVPISQSTLDKPQDQNVK